MPDAWLSTSEWAALVGVTRRAATKAAAQSFISARQWRGRDLVVRLVSGSGGRAGSIYELRSSCLPASLQQLLNGSEKARQLPLKLDTPADAERAWKEALLAPALRTDPKTPERRAAIRAIVEAEHVRHGRRVRVPERTVQRWIANFEAHGHGGLQRKTRCDVGRPAVLISRAWDAITRDVLGEGVRKRIAAQLAQRRRNLWGNGASFIDVQRLCSEFLADATADAGIALTDAALEAACALPKGVVEIDRDKRDVHEYRTDRKSWDDKRPRMILTSAGLRPMQIVYGDVHHFDILLEREDGSLATPKGIAWLDAATHRLRFDLVLCEPGTAVRNADLIDSFISMTQDTYWGMPETLYLDNGSEYRWAEFVKDALALTGMRCFTYGDGKRNAITRAQAYNAAAKGILEGSFRNFEQTIQAHLPGYLGGNRMQSRSANLGKAPVAWPGSFDDFASRNDGLMRYWMTRKRQGDLKGRSPQEVFTRFVEAGWERTDVDPYALALAFSVEHSRKVVDGKITAPGGPFYCDELVAYTGQQVLVRLPKYQRWNGIPVFDAKTKALIGVARPEHTFARNDPAGAFESARRKRVAVDAIGAKAATVERTDIGDLMIASADKQKPAPMPKSVGKVALADAHGDAGRELGETQAQQHDREHRKKQAHLRERLALARSKPGMKP